jgi:hypothetical protein
MARPPRSGKGRGCCPGPSPTPKSSPAIFVRSRSAHNSFHYEIRLQAKSDSVHGIRWLLKCALRRFGLRCTHAQRIGSSP